MWVKVHFYSTDRSRVFMYISAEQRAEYKKQLAERPATCCSWLCKNHNKERKQTLAAQRADKTKRRQERKASKSSAPESGAPSAATIPTTGGSEVSVSGVELGPSSETLPIQPTLPSNAASPSSVAADVGILMVAKGRSRQPAHHLTKMLPLDHDSKSAFRGFGKAESPPDAELPSYDDDEDCPQFVLALLNDHGAWKADLPVTASQVLGKESVFTAGQGNSTKLRLGADDANLSRQQLRVDTDATGDVSVTRLGPNQSYLQRAQGLTHSEPEPLSKGSRVVLRPGDILWLRKARYPLRLIECLPGLRSN